MKKLKQYLTPERLPVVLFALLFVAVLATFQSLSGLPMTGELDKITWKQLALHFPLAANNGNSSSRNSRLF